MEVKMKLNKFEEPVYTFTESVMNNLDIANMFTMLAVEDADIARRILVEASRDFLTLHKENLRKTRDQKISDNKQGWKIRRKSKPRKKAQRRVYHPMGANLFWYLVKEKVAVEEKKQEEEGRVISPNAKLFRFLHKLFENENFIKGSFIPLVGLLGILYNINPDLLVDISAHLHGIDLYYDKNHRDFRNREFFVKEGAKLIAKMSERFSPTGFFELVPIDGQSFHEEIKQHTENDIDHWFKFELADAETTEVIKMMLYVIGPWGSEPLSASDIPNQSLRYNRIEKLVCETGVHPFLEREIESCRSRTALYIEFIEVLLRHESVRINNMNNQMLVPHLSDDEGGNKVKLNEIKPLDDTFKLNIAMEELAKPLHHRHLTKFNLAIEIDGTEIGTVDSEVGKYDTVISKDSRILSLIAKTVNPDFSETSISLGTLLVAYTGVDEGEIWVSESQVADNHLGLKLIPVMDANETLESINLSIDYHSAEKCVLTNENSGWTRKIWNRFVNVKNGFSGGIVPQPVESFLNDLESVNLFSAPKAKRQGIKSSLAFTLVVTFFSMLLLIVIHSVRDRLPEVLLIPEIVLTLMVGFVSLILLISLALPKKKGINEVFRFCNQFSFLSGVISLVLMTSFFTHGWDKLDNLSQITAAVHLPSFELGIKSVSSPTTANKMAQSINFVSSNAGVPETNPQLPPDNLRVIKADNINIGVVANVAVKKPRERRLVQYVSGTIYTKKIETGDMIEAHIFDKQDVKSKDKNSNASDEDLKNKIKSLIARVTYVDKNACQGNKVELKVKLDKLKSDAGTEKPLDESEVTVILDADQKISHIALFLKGDKFVSAAPFSNENPVPSPKVVIPILQTDEVLKPETDVKQDKSDKLITSCRENANGTSLKSANCEDAE
jgi:hypothetical protein